MAGGEEAGGGNSSGDDSNTSHISKPVFPTTATTYPDTCVLNNNTTTMTNTPDTLSRYNNNNALYDADTDKEQQPSDDSNDPGYEPRSPQETPMERSDPPASTADEPVPFPPALASDDSYSEHMSDVLAKVGQEEISSKQTERGSFSRKPKGAASKLTLNENLSTDPNMPVFMKRKRGRPRKHPLPEQREGTGGRRAGRPPKTNTNRLTQRRIKKEPIDEPIVYQEQVMEELTTDPRLPTEQSMAREENQEENAIRFADVGNHLPVLVIGQHLCAVCLSRHSHRQTSGVRRTRSTSFKRFTSVVCRTCDKFLCIAPRADGRTCFDIYHTVKDFVRSDLPEFNRKDSGDSDVISTEFDHSPDLTEDTNHLLQLLQVASEEVNNKAPQDKDEKTQHESSMESVFPESSKVRTAIEDKVHNDRNSALGENPTDGSDRLQKVTSEMENDKSEIKEGQSQAITMLLKVLKTQRVVTVSETLQLKLEKRTRKYNMANRINRTLAKAEATAAAAVTVAVESSPEELTRKYRRKGRPRKHVSTDEETDKGEDSIEDHFKFEDPEDSLSTFKGFSSLITPGVRRKYACGRCHAEFNLIARMKVHLKAHIERKTYICNVCSASFRTKGKLAEHRKQHKIEKIHKCPKCEESFKKMVLLRRHMRTHQDVKPYECRICGSKFSYASSLKEHALNKHLGERPFKCSECNQGFIRQMNLLEHMRIHTGERPFKCKQCEQSFARKSGLKSHMISHTGEKKHMCGTCGARFRHKIALTEHQRTHTGEKPFVCSHCGQRFAASTTLRNHVRLHTGEKPHTCKVCGAGFAQRTSLNCHMKKHGVNPAENPNKTNNLRNNNWNNKAFNSKHVGNADILGSGTEGGESMPLDGALLHQQQDSSSSNALGHGASLVTDQGQGHHPNLVSQGHHPAQVHQPMTPMTPHHLDNPPMTPQPQDYTTTENKQPSASQLGSTSHASHSVAHTGHNTPVTGHGGSDSMMAQAVSMAFSKMVPDILQQGGAGIGVALGARRPESGPSPVPSNVPSQPHTPGPPPHTPAPISLSHHQVSVLTSQHHTLVPSGTATHHRTSTTHHHHHHHHHHDSLSQSISTGHHLQSQLSPSPVPVTNHIPRSATNSSLLHADIHAELDRPSSHHSAAAADIKPMSLPTAGVTSGSPWVQDPNLPTFPFDPSFHQMSQGFPPGMLGPPGQAPGHPAHGYPGVAEQPRFPFDNRFSMDAWPGHTNWKHKYQ